MQLVFSVSVSVCLHFYDWCNQFSWLCSYWWKLVILAPFLYIWHMKCMTCSTCFPSCFSTPPGLLPKILPDFLLCCLTFLFWSLWLVIMVVPFLSKMASTMLNTRIISSFVQLVFQVLPFLSKMASTMLNTSVISSFLQLVFQVVLLLSKITSTLLYFTIFHCTLTWESSLFNNCPHFCAIFDLWQSCIKHLGENI